MVFGINGGYGGIPTFTVNVCEIVDGPTAKSKVNVGLGWVDE